MINLFALIMTCGLAGYVADGNAHFWSVFFTVFFFGIYLSLEINPH